jgi:hypothetical protein
VAVGLPRLGPIGRGLEAHGSGGGLHLSSCLRIARGAGFRQPSDSDAFGR